MNVACDLAIIINQILLKEWELSGFLGCVVLHR